MRGAGPSRPGDGGGAVLVDGADGLAGVADLPGLVEAREHRVDVRLLHRELRRPEVVEGMAEGVDAVAVDVGDGARGRQVHVALDERHADGAARLRGRGSGSALADELAAPPITGRSPARRRCSRAHSKVAGSKPGEDQRQGERRQGLAGELRRQVVRAARAAASALRGRLQRGHHGRRSRGACGAGGCRRGAENRADGRARRAGARWPSIISPMGVMPAIVSLEKGNP